MPDDGDYLTCKPDVILRGDLYNGVLLSRTSNGPRNLGSKLISAEVQINKGRIELGPEPFEIRRLVRRNLVVFSRACHIEHPDEYLGKRTPVLTYQVLLADDNFRRSKHRPELARSASILDLAIEGKMPGYFYLKNDETYHVDEGFIYFWEPFVLDASDLASGRKIARLAPYRVCEMVAAHAMFEKIKIEDFEDDDPPDEVAKIRVAIARNDSGEKVEAHLIE
ncbi:MAG: hypothetical protein GIW98_03335 [Candidatus Eremiobacteraeota bacterium]|nr:hypothetical protein [Candidatus Eremiobacteraeota bacterium]